MKISSIFTRYLPAVHALHESCREDTINIATKYREVSLVDFILAGPKLQVFANAEDYKNYKQSIYNALDAQEDELPSVSKWEIFSFTEISALKAGYQFLKNTYFTDWWGVINATKPKWQDLVELSSYMTAPSTLLSLKYFWLFLNYDQNYPGKYEGILANTSPVRKTLKVLFGTDFGSSLQATMQQQRMASELDICAFNLNSILWLMGRE